MSKDNFATPLTRFFRVSACKVSVLHHLFPKKICATAYTNCQTVLTAPQKLPYPPKFRTKFTLSVIF